MLSKSYIKRIIKSYLGKLPIKVEYAILFGSTVKGTRMKESDIDLIVVSKDFKNLSMIERIRLLLQYWDYNVELEVFGFTQDEIRRLKNKSIIISEALEHGEKIKLTKWLLGVNNV